MKVVALLTVRNEERYLARCLEHLYSQRIETCLIDNGSTDNTLEIAQSFLGRGVIRIEHFPFNGCFELDKILLNEERLAAEIDADWFIHHDADEIREAPSPYKTLKEGIEDADRQGYNAINFDEFVFLPTSEDESFEGKDYVKEMRYYYFFEPHPLRRVNAWKKTANIDLHSSGGHRVKFETPKIFTVSFILRHYIVLSKSHAIEKYSSRIHSKADLQKGWMLERAAFALDWLKFPAKARLKRLNDSGNNWDKSEPWVKHEFLIGNSQANVQPQYLQIKTNSQLSDQLSESQDVKNLPPMPMIVGNPRSGTTLLRLMLDAHPDLAIPPETHFIPELFQLEGDRHHLREAFYKKLTADPRWPDFHLSADSFFTHLVNIDPFTITAGLRCFYQMYAKRFGKSRWGDKTPPYVFRIHDIQTLLPEAHFIHIIRDGRDVALSMKGMFWGAGDDMEGQASNWIWRIREGRQQAQFCQHYLEVRYEELITNPTKVLQAICAFINLPYHSQMEDYYQSAESRLNEFNALYKPDGTCLRTKEQYLSIHSLTSQSPDQSRIGRWKREMSNEDRAKYEAIAGAMLRDLGYETGDMQKQLTLSNPFLSEYGPNIIGSTGGSGTRVVARIVRRGGMFMGTKISGSEDAIGFGQYSTRWIDKFMAVRSSSLPPAIETEMLQEIQAILAKHLGDLDLSKKSQPWGWKEPRSIFLLPFFHKHFPNMKFLHILRDGRDMAYSHNQNQLRKHGSTLLESAEQQWSQPLQSMALWSRLHLLTAEYGEKNMPGQYLRIRYEDLCFEPVTTIQQIFDFFGLSGDIQKIAQEEVSPPTTIERWRTQDAQTVATLHQIGFAALQKFGYLASEELNHLNLEPTVISSLKGGKYFSSQLQEVKADLA
jgi:glycosyltransferase involved in cell wall biosynthesis